MTGNRQVFNEKKKPHCSGGSFQKRDKGGQVQIIVKELQLPFRAHWTPKRDCHFALYKYKVNKYNYVVVNFLCQVIFIFL